MFSGVGILVSNNFYRSTGQLTILPYLKLLRKEAGFEVRLDNNFDLQLGPAYLSHQGNHSERQRDVLCGAVPENIELEWEGDAIQSPHQLMLAVGRDEADGMLRLKLAQLHAPDQQITSKLMKFHLRK